MTLITATSEHSPTPITEGKREITVAHSPDSDDAFMFYGLATNKVRVPGLRFTHTLCRSRNLDHRLSGSQTVRTRNRNRCRPFRPDHPAGAGWQTGGRPHYSRRPVDLRQIWIASRRGSRQVGAESNWVA